MFISDKVGFLFKKHTGYLGRMVEWIKDKEYNIKGWGTS